MAPHSRPLEGRVAIITGAARGIAKGIAEEFAQAGAKLVLADLAADTLEQTAQALVASGAQVVFRRVDLQREEEIRHLVDFAEESWGSLDILVSSARPKLTEHAFENSFNEWDMVLNVLLKAPALLAKYARPLLRKSAHSCILNLTSSNAMVVSHQPLGYHVAAAGVVQLTRYLATLLGPEGTRVNAICPALVDLPEEGRTLLRNPAQRASVELAVPLSRPATAKDIAMAALFLCGDTGRYITGQVLMIDGGISVREPFDLALRAYRAGEESTVAKK